MRIQESRQSSTDMKKKEPQIFKTWGSLSD